MSITDEKYRVPALRTVDPSIKVVKSLSRLAYLIIRDKIITVELPPGGLIDEKTLSGELGLGRTPVREALVLLGGERYIHTIPRRGRVVSDISLVDFRRIYEARAAYEGHAVRLACERATEGEKSLARDLIAQLQALDRPDYDERVFIQLDQRVHEHVYRCVHNPFIEEMLVWYLYLSLRLWYFQMDNLTEVRAQQGHRAGISELKRLLQAIIDGDADAAEQVAAQHLNRSQAEILAPLHPSANQPTLT